LTGQKPPLKLKEIWAIRVRLQLSSRVRDLAMFNLAIDSKLRACDLTKLRVRDVCHGERIASRATITQQKTQRPIQFEITEQTRDSVVAWIRHVGLHATDFLFPSRIHGSPNLSTRQYARLVHRWIASIGLDDTAYGTPHKAEIFLITDRGPGTGRSGHASVAAIANQKNLCSISSAI
jgi:integrase